MKYIFRITATFIILANFAILSSQNRITKEIVDFKEVYVQGRINVELIPSSSNELTATSRTPLAENIEIEFKNQAIYIKNKLDLESEYAIYVKLPYKTITHIEATRRAVVNSARDVETDELSLEVKTGGKIELSVKSNVIKAEVKQISDIILYGETKSQFVNIGSGGNYLAYELESKEATITASGGGQGKVKVTDMVDATARSKSFIGYIGKPANTVLNTSLGGEIASFKTLDELREH